MSDPRATAELRVCNCHRGSAATCPIHTQADFDAADKAVSAARDDGAVDDCDDYEECRTCGGDSRVLMGDGEWDTCPTCDGLAVLPVTKEADDAD